MKELPTVQINRNGTHLKVNGKTYKVNSKTLSLGKSKTILDYFN